MSSHDWRNRIENRLSGREEGRRPSTRASHRTAAVASTPQPPRIPSPPPQVRPVIIHRPAIEDKTPLVPPAVRPPHGPESKTEDSTPKNMRFYVLLGCALWGLGLGFLFHLSQDVVIVDNQKVQSAQVTTPAFPIPRAGDNIESNMATAEDSDYDTQSIIEIERGSTPSQGRQTASEGRFIPPLNRVRYGGLSGRTLKFPAIEPSGPAAPAKRSSPANTLQDAEDVKTNLGPELEM